MKLGPTDPDDLYHCGDPATSYRDTKYGIHTAYGFTYCGKDIRNGNYWWDPIENYVKYSDYQDELPPRCPVCMEVPEVILALLGAA